MAASYPAGYDVMLEPGSSLSGPPLHDSLHLQLSDILAAIEAELGINPSGTDATVAATLAALPTRYDSGVVGFASSVVNQTGTAATPTDLTGLTVTFTATASRYYRTTVTLPIMLQSVATGIVQAVITDAAGVQKMESRRTAPVGNLWMTVTLIETGLTGSITRKARLSTNAGFIDHTPAATAPALIVVENIGHT